MSNRPVTSIEVAKAAGVSQSTVSRSFDPSSSVASATRQHVLEVARQLGYKPNIIARSLSTHKTNIVGVIMANLANSLFYPNVVESLTQKLQALGKQVLLFHVQPDQPVDDVLPRVLGYQVDGLVIASTTPSSELCDECARNGTPVVLFNRENPGSLTNAVCCDNVQGGRQVADFLLDAGHKRLAYIGGIPNMLTNTMRQKGFIEQLEKRGCRDVRVVQGAYTYESGYEAGRDLLTRDDPPDAIFCAADIMALGAMDVARYELGIKIPDELSIVGFDDIAVARYPAYSLTTICQPINAMVDAVVEFLFQDADDPVTGQTVLLPGELVIRASART